jgi:hypothetical protein
MTRPYLRFFRNLGLQKFVGARIASALVLAIVLMGGSRAANAAATKPTVSENKVAQLPLLFEENNGQTDAHARFLTRISGAKVFLMDDGFVFRSTVRNASPVRLRFSGGQVTVKPRGEELAPTKVNYLSGLDGATSLQNIPTYSKVRYTTPFPGVDVLAYGRGSNFEFDFIVSSGADLADVGFDVDDGAVSTGHDGSLKFGEGFVLRAPEAFQQDAHGVRHDVNVRYVLKGQHISLLAASYDRRLPLTVDPQLVTTYGTYLSGSSGSTLQGIATDGNGDTYVTGLDQSSDFPTKNALQTTGGLFISKLNPSGTALVYSTYIAGTTALPGTYATQGTVAGGHPLAVDSSGNAYLVGVIQYSDSFPLTASAYPTPPPQFGTQNVGFLLKLSADGSQVMYATYVGGSNTSPTSVAADSAGNAYVAGTAVPGSLPTTANAYEPTGPEFSVEDAFLAKFATTQSGVSSLPYSTYFGTFGTAGVDIACDNLGAAYLLGITLNVSTGEGGLRSGTITTRNAIQANPPGGGDAFLAKFDTTGSGDTSLLSATYIGGSGIDRASALALDSSNNVYVTGTTASGDFLADPPGNGSPVQSILLSQQDGFVTTVNATGSTLTLVYSTYIGNTSTMTPTNIAAMGDGEAVVTGTASSGMTTLSGLTVANPSGADNFLLDLSPTGGSYVYSTYLGNVAQNGNSTSSSFVTLQGAVAEVAGTWQNSAVALTTTSGAIQPTSLSSGSAGFISKFVFQQGTGISISNVTPTVGSNTGATYVMINGSSFESGATVTLNASSGAVQAQLVQVSTDGRTITGYFDLRGASVGAADIVVTNPDTTTATLSQAFIVQASSTQQTYSQVLGPATQRIGGGMVYTVLYGNNGNTDQFGVPLFITFNNTFGYRVLSPLFTPDDSTAGGHLDFTQDPLDYNDGNGHTVLELFVPIIRAGTTGAVQLLLTAPASQSFILSPYTIQSQLFPATFEVGPMGSTTSLRTRPAGALLAALGGAPRLFANDFDPPSFVRDLVPTASGSALLNALSAVRKPAAESMFWQSGSPQPQWVQNLVYTDEGRRCISQIAQNGISTLADGLGLVPGVNCVSAFTVNQFANQSKIAIGSALESNYEAPSPEQQLMQTAYDASGCIPIFGQAKAIGDVTKDIIFITYYSIDCASIAATGKDPLGAFIGAGGGGGVLNGQFDGAFDPNLKSGPVGGGTIGWISPTQQLNYSIEFQNTPTASAPAQSVFVVDAINSQVIDLNSIAFGSVVVGTHVYTPPVNAQTISTTMDLRPDVNVLVQVQAAIDTVGSALTWQFTSLDPTTGQPLPSGSTLGFLPADNPAPNGEGNLNFSAKMLPGQATGTSLTNGAAVIFDSNAPIQTPIWANTVDADAPSSQVNPLPAMESMATFPVSWAGTDVGSGITTYSIYVSQNGGPFTVWLAQTMFTSANYPGVPGNSYSFFSIAQDAAGNNEALKTAAETTTTATAMAAPSATLSQSMLSFSAQTVMTQSTPQTVMLTNGGNAPLTISSITITGGQSADFILNSQGCGASLAAGSSCNLTVAFQPEASGPAASTLFVYDNASNSPQITTLNGTGVTGTVATTTTLSSSTVQLSVRQSITLTATIAPTSSGAPTGNVSFFNGTTLLGTALPNANGIATLTLATLPAGTDILTASFAGDAIYAASTSNAIAINVSPQSIWIVNSNATLSELSNTGAAISPDSGLAGGNSGIAIDNAGSIWSANSSGNSLVKVSSGGSLLGTFMGGGLNSPDALAISGTGSVWVANANGSVSLFTNAGVADSPAAGFTGNGLDVPSAIAIDSSGNVWVANSGSNSVTELLGAADPVVTPLATAAASGTVGTKP